MIHQELVGSDIKYIAFGLNIPPEKWNTVAVPKTQTYNQRWVQYLLLASRDRPVFVDLPGRIIKTACLKVPKR